MAEELGRIEKPEVESFKKGRKLFFVPLVFKNDELPVEYIGKFHRYWDQAEKQIFELAARLGAINRVYHEMIATAGADGAGAVKNLNENSYKIVQSCLERQAQFEALEDPDILTEFMDWNRCLIIGLENPRVTAKVYEYYVESSKKRYEYIARRIDETLKADEIGLLLMRENHQVQFPRDIQVFYVSPPALDDIKRWLRDRETKRGEAAGKE